MAALGACLLCVLWLTPARAQAKREDVRDRVLLELLGEDAPDSADMAVIDEIWDGTRPVLDAVVLTTVQLRPQTRQALAGIDGPDWQAQAALEHLAGDALPPLVRGGVATFVARRLVRAGRFDDADALLAGLPEADPVDPATTEFLRATIDYQLFRTEPALAAIGRLRQVAGAPRRYLVVADLLAGRLETLEKEKLDGVAHDMRDLRRRLELDQTGQPTQELEADILRRLDAMIEQMEQQQQSPSGGSGESQQPDAPAPDSTPMGGKGEGKVGERNFSNKGSWGNLPPKEREKALQELGREFPPHYRDVVEEYFRRVGQEPQR